MQSLPFILNFSFRFECYAFFVLLSFFFYYFLSSMFFFISLNFLLRWLAVSGRDKRKPGGWGERGRSKQQAGETKTGNLKGSLFLACCRLSSLYLALAGSNLTFLSFFLSFRHNSDMKPYDLAPTFTKLGFLCEV